jgi:hypothetical protein
MRLIVCALATFGLAVAVVGPVKAEETDKLNRAIQWLISSCGVYGEKVEIKATGKGGFTLQNWKGTGIEGEVNFNKEEGDVFAGQINELSAKERSEVRECLKPYRERILNIILDEGTSTQKEPEPIAKKPSDPPVKCNGEGDLSSPSLPSAPPKGCVLITEWWYPSNPTSCGIWIAATAVPSFRHGVRGHWWYVPPERVNPHIDEYKSKPSSVNCEVGFR